MDFEFVSNNHNNIKEPFLINFTHDTPLSHPLTVYFLSDLTFQPRQYPIQHKLNPLSPNKYSIQLNFSPIKEEAQNNDQILNNFGVLVIKQIQLKLPMLFVSQKDAIYVTFIENKKRQNGSLAQTK